MKIIRLIVSLTLLVIMVGLPTAASAQNAIQVNTYETPCYQRERVVRGIPAYSVHEGRGLMAYTRAHLNGTRPDEALADYWAALAECDRTHPVGRWDWDSMVLVRVEYLG